MFGTMTKNNESKIKTTSIGPRNKVLSAVNDFRKSTDFCDVKLLVDGAEYPAHKIILSAFSSFFKTMFLGDYLEAKKSVVHLPKFDASTIDVILKYAYGVQIEITAGNAEDVLHAAHFLQANDLFETCCTFLEDNLSTDRWFYLTVLAEVFERPSFRQKAMDFALKNFPAISHEIEFFELDSDTLISLISDDALNVDNEEIVFDAVRRWYHCKEEERVDKLPTVFSHIRMVHIKPEILKKLVKEFSALRRSPSCMELVNEVLFYIVAPDGDEAKGILTRDRNMWIREAKVGMVFGKCLLTSKQKILCVSEDLQVVAEIQAPSKTITACFSSDSELYCLPDDWSCIYQFNFTTRQWLPIAGMITARKNFGFGGTKGKWYAIGGVVRSTGEATGIVERYDPETDVWCQVSSMPEALSSPTVASCRGSLIVLGGYTDNANSIASVATRQYDPTADQWKRLATLPVALLSPRIAVLEETPEGSFVFAWSLRNDLGVIRHFNVQNNAWGSWNANPKLVSGFATLNKGKTLLCICDDSNGGRVLRRYNDVNAKNARVIATFQNFQPESIHEQVLLAVGTSHYRNGLHGKPDYIRFI